ncbi:hypothetical protein ACTFIZ_012783 [Dictyostelium cf. discoideum]
MSNISLLSKSKSFNGEVRRYNHKSTSLSCDMKFHVYVPPKSSTPSSVLWFLSGLTCTDENFIQKSGAIQYASENNIFLVCPDTSPRGITIENPEDKWQGPGFGAGYYLNSTTDKYKAHFQMFTYITKELFELINQEFSDTININKHSIFGHSMGGLGAISLFIKTNGQYKSVSAFSPISNPTNCDWSLHSFKEYLGTENKEAWLQYDPCHLLKNYDGKPFDLLVDQGSADEFLNDLKFDNLQLVCKENSKINLIARLQDGYNHGYFYISTFIKDHIEYHSKHLNKI